MNKDERDGVLITHKVLGGSGRDGFIMNLQVLERKYPLSQLML